MLKNACLEPLKLLKACPDTDWTLEARARGRSWKAKSKAAYLHR